ncbi:MAG TPA: hypothetical protein VK963_00715 [Candidatus Saccharimonadales bacterium]|nr:hypothetical protein [Candidatus Saccharimonadales bacterium]
MNYPLSFRFKVVALASQVSAKDAGGNELFYIKQKLFKLKENIEVYRDASKSELLFTLKADRVIDFSPLLTLADSQGAEVGTVKRQGRASIWKATYDVTLHGQPVARVREANPWVKFFDGLLGEVPILSLFTGYLFHPKYLITDTSGGVLGELEKRPGFFEQNYLLQSSQLAALDETAQHTLVVLLMAVALREHVRG